MNTEELYEAMAKINPRPGSDKIAHELFDLLNSEDRFFSQEEVNHLLRTPFETYKMLKSYKAYYIDRVYNVPIYFFQVNTSTDDFSQLIFCTKEFFIELATDLIVNILESYPDKYITIMRLEQRLRINLQIYLGLTNRKLVQFPHDLVKTLIENSPSKFRLKSKSSLDDIQDYEVSLGSAPTESSRPILFLNHLISLYRKSENKDIKKLLLKLNLNGTDYGIIKPYTIATITKLSAEFPEMFKIDGLQITMSPLISRIDSSIKNRYNIDSFPFKNERLSGLLIFSFVGNHFPIKEAEEYVTLRKYVRFAMISNLRTDYANIINSEKSWFFNVLKAFLGDIDILEWANENLAVSFVIEDYDYLKLNFDKLMQEYSPVLNLEKNPGNLFRGIIEEKIREYESGKES